MRESTYIRIRASILEQLAEEGRPMLANGFSHRAKTSYDLAREARKRLESEGLIRTYRDLGSRYRRLMTDLIPQPERYTVIEENISLQDAMVIVRTAERTYVFSAVTGTFQVEAQIEEAEEHHYLIAPELPVRERGVDKITGHTISLAGSTPGYIHVPNMPPPPVPADQKEG